MGWWRGRVGGGVGGDGDGGGGGGTVIVAVVWCSRGVFWCAWGEEKVFFLDVLERNEKKSVFWERRQTTETH